MVISRLITCRLGLLATTARSVRIRKMSCNPCMEKLAVCKSSSALYRSISTSHQVQAGSRWRDSQGESRSGRDYGPLVDLPDWAYADGRPAPMGSGQLKRQQEQRQIAERIDRLAAEMTNAVQKEKDTLRAEQSMQREIDQHKLKPKGQAFRKRTGRNVDTV